MAQTPQPLGPFAPPAPFVAPFAGSIDERLAIIAAALNRKADAVSVPVYTAVVLLATDGSQWRLTVDTGGSLRTQQVPR
jgi:hypothetical protein